MAVGLREAAEKRVSSYQQPRANVPREKKGPLVSWTHHKDTNETPDVVAHLLGTPASWGALGTQRRGRRRGYSASLCAESRSCSQGSVGMRHGLER